MRNKTKDGRALLKTTNPHRWAGWMNYLCPAIGAICLMVFLEPISAAEILIFAIFGIGYDILLGYSGILSFGHAAFLGLGAYGTALFISYWGKATFPAMIAGILLSAVMAWPIGFLCLRRRGLYFAMITLGFAQALYFLAFKWRSFTGGADGMTVVRPDLSLGWGGSLGIQQDFTFNFFVLTLFMLMLLLGFRIIESPFGKTLQAIRENEERARAVGYDVDAILLRSFIISAFFGGVAGSLYTLLFRFISPDILFWSVSGQVVLMTIVGGMGTLLGPILGAVIFILLQDTLSRQTSHWSLIFGGIFMFFVIFAPKGIIGLIRERIKFRSAERMKSEGSFARDQQN